MSQSTTEAVYQDLVKRLKEYALHEAKPKTYRAIDEILYKNTTYKTLLELREDQPNE